MRRFLRAGFFANNKTKMNRSEIISKCPIAAFAALSIAGSAFAAESAPAANPQGLKSADAAVSSEKCPAWNERESLFIQGAVEKYAPDSGFSPFVTWTGEAWADVSRGSNVHSLFDSLFTVGFEQDLSAVGGSEGWGRIGVSAFYYTQSNDGSLSGLDSSQGCFSNIVAGEMARVFEIYYANDFETKFGNIGFRIGQLAADEDFMGMDYSDVFLNSSLGAIPNVAPAQMFSQYNVATLGIVVYYSYENFDLTLGVYNGNVGADISSNNGFDYSNTFETIAFWYQLGYNYELGGLAGRVVFGGNYHSDPSKVNFDQIDAGSFYSFFVGVQQALVNDSEGNAMFGAFARFGIAPDSKSSDQNFYTDFGINWFAPIPGRDDDVFAVAFSIVGNEHAARADYAHYESTLEVTYRCQLTPAIAIQPDMQIFMTPNNGDTGAAYVVGARVEVNF